jgi:acyl-CoA synthetase (AMP-forming)/AMP-acid ligase II
VPLNPLYRDDAFEFYLTDLKAKALILEAGQDSPSRVAAARLNIPILELRPNLESGAGDFRLEAPAKILLPSGSPGLAEPDDIALVLHTSGTTSRPNIVPLSQRNIASSARQILTSLQLSPADTCLNIMPLFHIHGLMAGVTASIGAGASVVCTPGFNALRFYAWVDELKPTWYTAVPTMHQAILGRARGHRHTIERMQLRFLRSASAPLPAQVMGELEQVFHAPVIESYGMTEASHQIAANPLPPQVRRPGSVGVAALTQV